MRNTVLILILIVLLSGCLTGENCKDETISYTSTELVIEKSPKDITNASESWTPIMVRREVGIPLAHEILDYTGSNTKWPVGDELSLQFDRGNFNQNITAEVKARIRNNDNVSGNFTVVVSILYEGGKIKKNQTIKLKPSQIGETIFIFNISREVDWSYSIKIVPDKKYIDQWNIDKTYDGKYKTIVGYDYVRNVVDVLKNKTIRVCD